MNSNLIYTETELNSFTVATLRQYAASNAIYLSSKSSKAEIINSILEKNRLPLTATFEDAIGRAGQNLMPFFNTKETRNLRLVAHVTEEKINEFPWRDYETSITDLKKWRKQFPRAKIANISNNKTVTDADFTYLTGIHTLDMNNCPLITDEALRYLTGIHTLYISDCYNISDKGLSYITGVKELAINNSNKSITNKGLSYLTGIEKLSI